MELFFNYSSPISILAHILSKVLTATQNSGTSTTKENGQTRIHNLSITLFRTVILRSSRGFLEQDKLIFALCMAQIYV